MSEITTTRYRVIVEVRYHDGRVKDSYYDEYPVSERARTAAMDRARETGMACRVEKVVTTTAVTLVETVRPESGS